MYFCGNHTNCNLMSETKPKLRLFISYAHDDKPYFDVFNEGLKKVVKNTKFFDWSIWDDRQIHIGTFWDETIKSNIHDCNVALLLVSMDFMASTYIKEEEYKTFFKRYEDKGILIVPVMFGPCNFELWEDLSKLQFYKPDGTEYGKAEVKDFTYSHLFSFNLSNGSVLPNTYRTTYHLNLVNAIEASYKHFLDTRPVHAPVAASITVAEVHTVSENKLSKAPNALTYFTGRETEIDEFKKAIDDRVNFIAIDGPGGIGKTQFVSRCIEKFIDPEKIIWYNCTVASQLDTLIAEAGYPELLKGSSKSDREKFSAFKDKIEENIYYLFLDNFQETNGNPVFKEFLEFAQGYLHKGCVVIIDRDDIRNETLTPRRIPIEGLKEKRLDLAKALIEHAHKNVRISDDELLTLCDQLQGYPFAINLALLLISRGTTVADVITKIVQQGDVSKAGDRLLNAIFTRSDATQEEKDFITQFSVFTGKVSKSVVEKIIPVNLTSSAPDELQKKNLLTIIEGNYEVHPLVREFCYKKLDDHKPVHARVAEYYISQRVKDQLSPSLEEQIFYHLSKSEQWDKIEKEIEDNGRQFILLGQLSLVKELLDKLKELGIEKPIFDILYGDIAQIRGDWNKAQQHYNIAQIQDIDNKIKVEGQIKFAEMLYRKGDAKAALPLFESAVKYAQQYNFQNEEARALNDIGLLYKFWGRLDESFQKLNAALLIRQNINDRDGIAISFNNLGSLLLAKDKSDEALKMFERGLEIWVEMDSKEGIADSLCGIGIGWQEKNRYDIALMKTNESLELYKEIGSKSGIAVAIHNIATAMVEQGYYSEAIEKLHESLVIEEELQSGEHRVNTIATIGVTYLKKKIREYDNALIYLFESLALSNKIGSTPRSSSIISWIIDIRDNDISLAEFKSLAQKALDRVAPAMRKYIPIKELLQEPVTRAGKKYGSNDKVSVRYSDNGKIVKDVKYKKVKDDIDAGKCEIIEG